MKSRGSYAALSPSAITTSKMQTSANNNGIALLSVQNNDSRDWPVSYNPGNNIFSLSCYYAHTRNNQMHFIYSWYSLGYEGKCLANRCYLHLCTRNPSTVSDNGRKDEWDGSGSALDSDSLGIVRTMEIYAPDECGLSEGWVSASEYSNCYAVIEMLVDNTDDDRLWSLWNWTLNKMSYYSKVKGSAPSLAYNESNNSVTVGASMSGRRILEFRDKSTVSPTGIRDEETLMNFYYGSLINLEGWGDYRAYYYDSQDARLEKWLPGTYSVAFIDTVGDSLSSIVSRAVNNAISQVNSIMSEFGIRLVRNDGGSDITITYGTMRSLWGESVESDGYFHGGQWETILSGNYIVGARIGISREVHYYSTFSQVCFEELFESMGCGFDQWEYPSDTTTLDMGGPWNPDYVTSKDANMLRLVYSNAVNAGDDPTTVALAHNIPKGVKLLSTNRSNATLTASLSFLKPDHTYEIRVWIIDTDGSMSSTSSWLTITIPDKMLLPWDWQSSNGIATAQQTRNAYYAVTGNDAVSDFSYLVWNDLVDKTKEVLDAYGYSWSNTFASYSATKMTASDRILTAARFNSLRFNIGSYASTGIETVQKGDIIYGWYFTRLTDRLNSLI